MFRYNGKPCGGQNNAEIERDKEKDNIYLNVIINGSEPKYNANPALAPTGEGGILAEFNVVKSEPYLDKPNDYYCSVIRYVIPLQLVPLFIMPIIPNQGDADKSTLLFGMFSSFSGLNTSQYVEYFPDNTFNAPQQNQPYQVKTPYYYVYTYTHMIQMVNYQLNQLWISSGLQALYNGSAINLAAGRPLLQAPFFSYDPTTQLISLTVPYIFVEGFATASLYMNAAALQYFEAYHLSFQGYNQPFGKDFVFIFNNNPNNYYSGIPNPPSPPSPPFVAPPSYYYQYTQDYNTLYYWNSLRKILITTSSIPISSEIVPANLQGVQQSITQPAPPGGTAIPLLTPANSGGQQYTAFPIITDYIIDTNAAGQSRGIAVYNPQIYRLLDMSGESPISGVDLKIFWSDVQGNLYPLYIPQNQQVSVKIAFFRKSLYKYPNNLRV